MQIGAVIVAAGMSSRMGDFKPMLNIGSISIAQRIVATFHQAGVSKIVVVTGATSGIGEAAARMFRAKGADVAAIGRNKKKGDELEKCGMHYEGTLRSAVFAKNQRRDVCLGAILRENFIAK